TNRSFSYSDTDRSRAHLVPLRDGRSPSLRAAQQRQQGPPVRLGRIRMLEGELVAENLDLDREGVASAPQRPERAAQQFTQLLLVGQPDRVGQRHRVERP